MTNKIMSTPAILLNQKRVRRLNLCLNAFATSANVIPQAKAPDEKPII